MSQAHGSYSIAAILTNLKESLIKIKILVYLSMKYPQKATITDIYNAIRSSHYNATRALNGKRKDPDKQRSLISMGLVAMEHDSIRQYSYYSITPLGFGILHILDKKKVEIAMGLISKRSLKTRPR